MKTNNKKKVVVSVLALAMGAGLAGSISGSVAWYQYSTRTAAQFVGTSAGTTRNLQIAQWKDGGAYAEDDWKQYINLTPATLRPASVYGTAGSLNFVDHPVYQYDVLPEATANGYKAEFKFVFRCVDAGTNAGQKAKKIYLSQLNIVPPTAGTGVKDITDAVRLEINGTNDFIIAKTAGTTTTHGNLDLNANGNDDTTEWDTQDLGTTKIDYKNAASNGDSYTAVAPSAAVVTEAGLANAYDFSADTGLADKVLTTTATSGASEAVTITLWIEGWQELESEIPDAEHPADSTIWDLGWINQSFTLQFQFTCEADA